MEFPEARLEQWMREKYFAAQFDIGSSGVENFRLDELRELIGLSLEELDRVVFHDSHTLGEGSVRQAIADRFAAGRLECVMVTHGSTEANYLLHLALLNSGDEVVVMEPAYQQLAGLARGLGARCKVWQLAAECGFAPDLNDLAALLTPKTRMIIVNFPHNPTGAVLSRSQYDEFLSLVDSCGAWLVWDAAFAELVYESPILPDPSSQYPRALSMGTLSKAYGLPGLRVGWLIAPPEVLAKCVRIRDYVSLHLSPLVELLAERVIRSGDAVVRNRRERARGNLASFSRWAAENAERIEWIPPHGGVCAFPRLRQVRDVDRFCHVLACRERVLTVPGSCFGCPQHIRLGFGGPRHDVDEGLSRLAKALADPNFANL